MIIKRSILALLTAIILGCSDDIGYETSLIDGIKHIHNRTTDKELDIKLNEIARIDGGEYLKDPISLAINSKNDIYILDESSGIISCFDTQGRFLHKFLQRGQGPAEATDPENIFSKNDTIIVVDDEGGRLLKFDKIGNFLGKSALKRSSIPFGLTPMGEGKFIGFTLIDRKSNGDHIVGMGLSIFNNDLTLDKNIITNEQKFDPDNLDIDGLVNPFAVGENQLFVASNSRSKYWIDVYNFSGEKLYSISKQYIKIKYSDEEKVEYNKNLKRKYGLKASKLSYRKAINTLYVDRLNRLWVNSSIERNSDTEDSFIVDIFNNGILQSTQTIEQLKRTDSNDSNIKVQFENGTISLVDRSNNEIKIFSY